MIFVCYMNNLPIPVAVCCKVPDCGPSLAGIAFSNPAGVMDICPLKLLLAVR